MVFPKTKKVRNLQQTRHQGTDSPKKNGTSNFNLNSLDRLRKLQLFNNYSSRPNGLLPQRPWGREYISTDPITFQPDHCRDKRKTKTHTTEKISLKSESCLFKLRFKVATVNIKWFVPSRLLQTREDDWGRVRHCMVTVTTTVTIPKRLTAQTTETPTS